MYKLLFLLLFVIGYLNMFAFTDSTCIGIVNLSLESDPRPTNLPDRIYTTHFIIHYNTYETNFIYANNVATYAEFAYEEICIQRGWLIPPPDDNRGGDNRYDIYILSTGAKGVCKAEFNNSWTNEWAPSFIEIRNNLEDGDNNGELRIVVAHEFSHATQFAYTYRDGYPNNFWFYENCATYFGEYIYGFEIYQYFQNFWGVDPLNDPELRIDTQGRGIGLYPYAGFIWPMFLVEWTNDNDIIRDIWERMGQNPGENIMSDIDFILSQPIHEKSLTLALTEYAVWRYFTGERADQNTLKRLFPTAKIKNYNSYPTGNKSFDSMGGLGGVNYITFSGNYEVLNIIMNGEDNIEWKALYIVDNGYNNFTKHIFPINSYGDGSIEVIKREINKIVLIPICLTPGRNGGQGYFSASVSAKRAVKFSNSYSQLNLGGQLLLNNNDVINSGDFRILSYNTYSVKTKNERFIMSELKKHNNWNNNLSLYYLIRDFDVTSEGDIDQNAQFIDLRSATIRNLIDGVSFNDQLPIWFSDPWYVFDENDNQLGMGNYITPRPLSPYQPTGKYSYTTGGVFLNQVPDPNNPNKPYYSVKADAVQNIDLQQTGRTHKFYFQNWSASPQGSAEFQDANALQTPVVFKQEGATVQANLKGTQLSNNSYAYSKGSQRKLFRDANGVLYNVYESMNRVWLEKSTNNGVQWQLTNHGLPLSNNVSKNPAVCNYNGFPLVVFEELGELKVYQYEPSFDNAYLRLSFYSCNENYTATPVITYSFSQFALTKILVVWKTGNAPFCGNPSLYYVLINPDNWSITSEGVIPNTNNYSLNPTIDSYIHPNGGSQLFHLAWEQSGAILYCKLVEDGNGNISQTNYSTISNGSSYMFHTSPSIIALGTGARVCWLGWNDEDPVVSAVVLKDPANSRFWSFGSNVSRPNINKSNDNTYYAFAWSQNNSTVKFADNNLRSIYEIIGIPGKDVQISNGNGKTNMYANIFKATSQPYYFTLSSNLNTYYSLQKSNGLVVSNGRTGVLRKNGGEIYFALGDITIDDQKVGFIECSPEVDISNVNLLNQYLETEPFEVTDNSGLEYTVQYGIVDSSTISGMFSQGEQVRFKVELVDINTGQVLGVFDDVVYDQNNLTDFENILYQVNTQGIGQRIVKLRLRIEENITPEVSMVDRIDNGSALAKGKKKELNYLGETIPKEFALSQNYPNPFNPTTVISWQSPVASHQTLKVYDILGNEVVTLVDEYREAGRYKVEFDASSLASGVYIYKLTAGSFTSSKKMMVVK
ncbi:T9SS type A sorting domain-containing protein [Ignavibacterium sp.]|uniref:T9SS type A sorting domain-containing protein n=1 Tax=Ignavibacterium sp. TaxID=2651167 RepID=UPI0021FBA47C|nr:T9SS type A sorting domain-containing protein [Ignavibacterium sp.]BDQ03916.1 MAG: hypothetical protein KatS3mg037_2491 [Ignavibacterium sp.]